MNLEKVLNEKFGHQSFRRGQKEIISDCLKGLDVLAMLPTGTGKSLCYQLPGYIMKGAIIIVSPLLSLMEDQVTQMKSYGEKRAVAINSFLTETERRHILNQLANYKFIYISPEALQSEMIKRALKNIQVALFVIDEAHCISQWGYEFRTDYLKLASIRKLLGDPPCLALTATATKEVQEDIVSHLQMRKVKKHIYSADRPNIALKIEWKQSKIAKIERLVQLVKELNGPGIVYVSSRYWSEELTAILRNENINTAFYHAGLETEERLLIQNQFLEGQLDVICCTNAFGMGINKANVRFIIHFHYPQHVEAYLQEIGRAGRDGEKSIAILLYCEDDSWLPLSLIEKEFPTEDELKKVLTILKHDLTVGAVLKKRVDEEIKSIGLSETAWRFILYQLEELAIITKERQLRSFNIHDTSKKILDVVMQRKKYKFKKLIAMKELLETASCRREVLLSVFEERLEVRPKYCCDRCGLDISLFYENHLNTSLAFKQHSWQNELKKILHQSEDEAIE
ncbi:RecQ family ATP-dependent DNA helicase [Bacillus taeanensis]|uniref:ATP-dependent DNA helicase RecQ n=1 Tax=Bacillus taeanensis TaxID=273032 RepID=A0A366XVA8_9BACI|nr:ATP-dependent DNA helicase RecQ [Bacillus taeanensis]RBW70320.1 ATP-dependent DNA helicase [Bacillus taeanensis]